MMMSLSSDLPGGLSQVGSCTEVLNLTVGRARADDENLRVRPRW